jgi:serine/threonine protein kinase
LYLAPELFDGAPATPAADIYSLGVLLYHLVSGSYPVDGTTREEIARTHAQGGRKPLRDCRPDLPEPFVRIVERAVARHPHDRFPTAGACADALGSALGFSPLTSVRASDAHAPARTRWPVAVFLLSVAAAASIATSALVSWRVSAKTFETAAVSGVRLQCR